jgi:hypothetical protein
MPVKASCAPGATHLPRIGQEVLVRFLDGGAGPIANYRLMPHDERIHLLGRW